MSLRRKQPKPKHSGNPREPDAPEAVLAKTAGTPMSHESIVVLARLEAVADRLEGAVLSLERQTYGPNEDAPEESSDA